MSDSTRKRRSATCIRLPESLHDRIEAEAKSRGVPMNWLITRLLAEGVERLIPADEMRLTRRES